MACTNSFGYLYDDSPKTQLSLVNDAQYDFKKFDSNIFLDKLFVAHLNIRSALSKMDELYTWLTILEYKPSVLCLTET